MDTLIRDVYRQVDALSVGKMIRAVARALTTLESTLISIGVSEADARQFVDGLEEQVEDLLSSDDADFIDDQMEGPE